jgi:hypothetical protein
MYEKMRVVIVEKISKFIVVILCIVIAYFSMGFLIEKHREAMIARITISNPPHPVGYDCIFEDIPVAIYNKYLDKNNQWRYNVMMNDIGDINTDNNLNMDTVIMDIPHKLISNCKE